MITLRYCAIGATLLTFGMIVLGALVRTTGSGLSCPDWPTCYGVWFPTPATVAAADLGYTYTQVMLEWVHRFVAGFILGPVILAIGFFSMRRGSDRDLRIAGLGLVFLLLVQGALGGLTVLDANSPWSVALHLSNALVLLAILTFFVVRTSFARRPSEAATLAGLIGTTVIVAIAAMAAAAMTAKAGASLACSSWPLCNESLVPDMSDPAIAIHVMHRFLAGTLVLMITGLAWLLPIRNEVVRLLCRTAFALVILQAALGAGLIAWYVPMPLAVAHQALAVLLFTMLVAAFWLSRGAGCTERPSIVERSISFGRLGVDVAN